MLKPKKVTQPRRKYQLSDTNDSEFDRYRDTSAESNYRNKEKVRTYPFRVRAPSERNFPPLPRHGLPIKDVSSDVDHPSVEYLKEKKEKRIKDATQE